MLPVWACVLVGFGAWCVLTFALMYWSLRPKPLDYDKRWDSEDYVAMVHRTRTRESEMGLDLTECGCSTHRRIQSPPRHYVFDGVPGYYDAYLDSWVMTQNEFVAYKTTVNDFKNAVSRAKTISTEVVHK